MSDLPGYYHMPQHVMRAIREKESELTEYVREQGFPDAEVRFDMTELPVTDKIIRRPVFERMLRRRHHMPLEPPTEAEKADAIEVLRFEEDDDLYREAWEIFVEASE